MRVAELRVGNWIQDLGDDEMQNYQIEQICKDSDGFKGYYIVFRNGSFKCKIDSDGFQPIPLTEEWLLKFGFKLNKLGNLCKYIETKENGSRFITFKYSNYYKNWYIYLEHNPPCQYVHQLQNIIFVLTGEELEVKL